MHDEPASPHGSADSEASVDEGVLPPSPFVPDELLRREKVPTRAWVLLGMLVLIGVASLVLTSLRVGGLGTLFLYSIPSNTAISVMPHEPMLLIYGSRANLWLATLAATGGTLVAGWLDHRIFVPTLNVDRISAYKRNRLYRRAMHLFGRTPFGVLVLAGLTPVPFFPFKLLAFSGGYPLGRYLGALALGRFPRYAVLVWVGSAVYIPSWILIGLILMAFLAYGVHFLVRRDREVEVAES